MSPEDGSSVSATAQELLQQGIRAAQEERRGEARRYLQQVLALDPLNEEAWLWLARIATDPRSALAYFAQVLDINPQNQHARDGFINARARLSRLKITSGGGSHAADSRAWEPALLPNFHLLRLAEKAVPPPASPASKGGATLSSALTKLFAFLRRKGSLWGWIGLAILAVTLIMGVRGTGLGQAAWDQWIATSTPTPTPTPVPTPTPTKQQLLAPLWSKLDGAWKDQAWSYVIELLEEIRNIDPANADAEEKLFAAHFNFATQLVEDGQLEQAIAHFDQALLLRPGYPPAQEARELATTYLKGAESHHQGSWAEAIASLEKVYQKDRSYQEVGSLLYEAHWRQGALLQANGQLAQALAEYRRALEIWPEGIEARTRRDEVAALLKRIEIDVSEQRLTAWDGDKLVYSFVCSTGKHGTPTKYGRFSVISKVPEAYSSVWDLRMPYWLGIYWAGGSENGIHGLPILSNGQTLWAGYLGQPISYGCIVLDTWAAKQLYDWAEIGTEVIIRE
jgi:tetratricopeptide (TPR) repeat protein